MVLREGESNDLDDAGEAGKFWRPRSSKRYGCSPVPLLFPLGWEAFPSRQLLSRHLPEMLHMFPQRKLQIRESSAECSIVRVHDLGAEATNVVFKIRGRHATESYILRERCIQGLLYAVSGGL
jgi:hypothetical protein